MSNNNQNNQPLQEEQLKGIQDIKSTLGYVSSVIIALRSDIDNNLRELKKENQKHLHILLKRTDLYFYITVILLFILFCQPKLGSLPFFASLFLEQILLLIG